MMHILQTHRMSLLSLCLGVMELCSTHIARAATGSTAVERIAMFPLTTVRGGPKKAARSINKNLVQQIQHAAAMQSLEIIEGRALRRALHLSPVVAIGKCGTDPGCAAELGKKIGAQRVLMGRVVRDGSAFTALLVLVTVDTRTIAQTLAININNAKQPAQALRAHIATLLAGPDTRLVAESELMDLALPSLDEQPTADPPLLSLPQIPANKQQAASDTATTARVTPSTLLMSNVPEALPKPAADRTLTWIGSGALGLGAALAASGTYLGISAKSMAKRPAEDTSQLDYADTVSRAKSRAKLATTLYIGAGVAAATGVALFLWDVLSPTPQPEGRIEVGATPVRGGAEVAVGVHW